MKVRTLLTSTVFALYASACSETPAPEAPALETQAQALSACTPKLVTLGVLIDDASPAKAGFAAAATLAGAQLNAGLSAVRSCVRFEIASAFYPAGGARAAAIDLVNNRGALALVSDISGNTAAVNALNYETPRPIVRNVPVTCYQCSSAFFNDPAQTNPGFADPANWLFRTFFNATFESAVQVQLVLNKPAAGEITGDGHLKIAVYYDSFHLSAATTMPTILNALHSGAHSVELIAKTLPSTPATRAAELAALLDSGPDGHAPDAVYLAFLPQNAPEALADYRGTGTTVPVQANNGVRRNFLLPTLLANGGEGLEGSSVRTVADSRGGRAFLAAYRAAGAGEPELTASFLYDAVVAQALAVEVATRGGFEPAGLSAEGIRGGLGAISAKPGITILPAPLGFAAASLALLFRQPIDYDGASSPLDLTAPGEMYPDLVHWKIQGGKFVELEAYRCDPAHPNCAVIN